MCIRDRSYVADAYGAYETVHFTDGIVVKANVSTTGRRNSRIKDFK